MGWRIVEDPEAEVPAAPPAAKSVRWRIVEDQEQAAKPAVQQFKDIAAAGAGDEAARRAVAAMPPLPVSMTASDEDLGIAAPMDFGTDIIGRKRTGPYPYPLNPGEVPVPGSIARGPLELEGDPGAQLLASNLVLGGAGKLVGGVMAARAAANAAKVAAAAKPLAGTFEEMAAAPVAEAAAPAAGATGEGASVIGKAIEHAKEAAHHASHGLSHAVVGGLIGHAHGPVATALGVLGGIVAKPLLSAAVRAAPTVARAAASIVPPAATLGATAAVNGHILQLAQSQAQQGAAPIGQAFEAIHNGVPAPLAMSFTEDRR